MFSAIKTANGQSNGAAPFCSLPAAPGHQAERALMRMAPSLTRPAIITTLLPTVMGCWLLAGDSWEKKPYTEWTESEALKVLQDSAWSKLSVVWTRSEALIGATVTKTTTGETRVEEHSNCCRTFTRVVDGASLENSPSDAASLGRPVPVRQALYYRVLIYSSVRVRQALARLRQLRGEVSDAQAGASPEKPLDDLVVAVAGSNMQPFDNTARETILRSTYLRSKKGDRERVELKDFVPPGIRQDGLALFVFSREVNGKPAFNMADDLIEFRTGEESFKIRASFKLEKMVVNGVPDL